MIKKSTNCSVDEKEMIGKKSTHCSLDEKEMIKKFSHCSVDEKEMISLLIAPLMRRKDQKVYP